MTIQHPDKIGIGTGEWISDPMQPIVDVGRASFSWYYDWGQSALSSASTTDTTASFIPMTWNANDVTSANLSVLKARGATTLLGFNEPDNLGQANMSVGQALSLWPTLMATGLRLGSPAPTQNDVLGDNSWLGQFMAGAKSQNLTVDFIALHYYSADQSVDNLKNWLQAVYAQYNKPIWVTEWCLADWSNPGRFSATEQASFAQAGTAMMDSLPFVERQAWFAAYNGGDGWNLNSGIFDASGNLTPVGVAFRDLNTSGAGLTGVVDNTPPVLTTVEDISGLINRTSIGLSGTVNDDRSGVGKVEVYDTIGGHLNDLGAAVIGSNGTWTFKAVGLTNGTHQFAAAATDVAGNTTGQISAGAPVTVDTVAPQPVIKTITGNRDGGVTLAGISEANSTVAVTDTVGGKTVSLGSVVASTTGVWKLTSHVLINTSSVNSFSASAFDPAGNMGIMPGILLLSSTGNDTLTSTSGASDVFAIMSFKGSDVIKGFQAASVGGSLHDYIDFSGRGITSFSQVQSVMSGTVSTVLSIGSSKTITLIDVAPQILTAADFRFS